MKDDEIRILILEDNPTDAELVEHELRKGGIIFQSKRVETRDDFICQIEEFNPQVILSDYKLPAFDGITAFTIIKEKGLDVPFIIVSGMLGEDLAIETLKAGVTDYVLKSNLNRLVPAVNRALAETKLQTERRQAEGALRKSEERYRTLFEAIDEGFCIVEMLYDSDGKAVDYRFVETNPAFEKHTGLQHALGKTILQMVPNHEAHWFEIYGKVARTGEPIRFENPAHAMQRYYEVFAFRIDGDGSQRVGILFNDITKRKRAEQHLLQQMEWKNLFLLLYGKASQLTDKDLYDYVLKQAVRLTGSTIGFFHLVSDDQKTIMLTAWNAEALKNCTVSFLTHYPIDQAGNWVDCFHLKRPVIYNDFPNSPNQKGLPEGHTPVRRFMSISVIEGDKVRIIFGVGNKTDEYDEHDVALLQLVANDLNNIIKKSCGEKAFRESEERYRLLIENINLGITLIGTDYKIIMTNTGQAKLFNKPVSAFSGKQCFREFEKRSEVCPHCPGTIAMATGLTAEAETTGIHDDGNKFSAYLHAFPIFEQNGEISGFIEVVEDITERKRAEEQMLSLQAQLQQSQKMEAIGRLAGGVAHDFNNLLTVIIIQTQLSLLGLWEGDPLKAKLKDVAHAADRAADLTRQLLAFSRRQIMEVKIISPNVILNNMEKMLQRVIGEDIEFKVILPDDVGMVKVDPGQMEQVVMNLVINARDAMPQGGKLLLETANVELDEKYTCSHVGMMPGAYVKLSITDNGEGMTQEVKDKIFDPFFTTKENGKGTGLGLSTVYGIVKQSGGDIKVFSEPRKGTTFTIYQPRVFEPPEGLKKEEKEELPRGRETILVVEDEAMVRRLAIDILKKQGYRVLEARSGGEAMVMCAKANEPIHLILTDIVMPHMSGPELIERLKQVRKGFKVLYMTGYTGEPILQQGILEEEINLVRKPFTIGILAQKVRAVLDKN